MENLLNPEQGFYLEEWFVDPLLCRVSKAETQIRVEPKVMDVLVLLALNRNRVLRKDEIIGHVWGEVNVVENVLARAVSEIRKVFGDDAKNQSIIQTIPKVGYRLIAKVSPKRELAEDVTGYETPVLAMPAGSFRTGFNNWLFRKRGVGAGVAILLAVAVLLIITVYMSGTTNRKMVKKHIILLHETERPNG